jgi:crossover junction endodeoxyribonuclease RuvC
MRILGIDPGTVTTGYGVIEHNGDNMTLIDYGSLSPTRSSIGERLFLIYRGLLEIISHHQPHEVAIEEPFLAKNVRSALAVGRAQAIAILAAATSKVPSHEYTPTQVKRTVADYGGSGKEQVQHMVTLLLGLSEIPEPEDAADALAVAICHARECHLKSLLKEQSE